MCLFVCVCMHVHVFMHACIHICMHVCMYIYIYTHTHTHGHVHVYICTVCTYACVYVWMQPGQDYAFVSVCLCLYMHTHSLAHGVLDTGFNKARAHACCMPTHLHTHVRCAPNIDGLWMPTHKLDAYTHMLQGFGCLHTCWMRTHTCCRASSDMHVTPCRCVES